MTSRVINADCREAMREFAADSIDAIVTDPPYHLIQASRNGSRRTNVGALGNPYAGGAARAGGFMGKVWDGGDIAHDPTLWSEALRVLKPGAQRWPEFAQAYREVKAERTRVARDSARRGLERAKEASK